MTMARPNLICNFFGHTYVKKKMEYTETILCKRCEIVKSVKNFSPCFKCGKPTIGEKDIYGLCYDCMDVPKQEKVAKATVEIYRDGTYGVITTNFSAMGLTTMNEVHEEINKLLMKEICKLEKEMKK